MSCFYISLLALVAAIANVDAGGFLAKTDQFSEVASDDSISNDEASAGYTDAEVAQDMPSGLDDTSPQVEDASPASGASSSFVGLKPNLLQQKSDLTLLQTEQQEDQIDPESDLALYGKAFTQMDSSEEPTEKQIQEEATAAVAATANSEEAAESKIQEGDPTESFVQLQNATAAVGEHLKTLVKEESKFLNDLQKIETVDSESPAKTLEEVSGVSGYTDAEVQQELPTHQESPVQKAIGFLEEAPTVPQEPSSALVQVQSESKSDTADTALFNFWEAESKFQGKDGSGEGKDTAVSDTGNSKDTANSKADDFDKYYKPNAAADADGASPTASWIQEDMVNGTATASKAFVQVQSDYEDPESDSALYGHPAEESLVQVPNAAAVAAVKKEEENKVPNATAVMALQAEDKDAKVKEADRKSTQNVSSKSSASNSFVQMQSQQQDPESDMALYGSALFLNSDVDSQSEDGDAVAYQIDSPDVNEGPTLDL